MLTVPQTQRVHFILTIFLNFFTTKALISHYLWRRYLVYDYILSKQWFSWTIWISYSKFYCNIGNKTNVFIGKKYFYSYLVCFIWIYARHNQTIVFLHPILLKMKKIKMIWNGACVLYDEFIVRLKKEQLWTRFSQKDEFFCTNQMEEHDQK